MLLRKSFVECAVRLQLCLLLCIIRLRLFLVVVPLSTVAIALIVSATVEECIAILLVSAVVVVASIAEELLLAEISTVVSSCWRLCLGGPVPNVRWL